LRPGQTELSLIARKSAGVVVSAEGSQPFGDLFLFEPVEADKLHGASAVFADHGY
jgi:hypothetical protein